MQRVKTAMSTERLDTLHTQLHVGDVTHPDLIGTHDRELLDQVRIAREGMLTVGGPGLFRRPMTLHPKFLHQALDMLAVDLEALAPQLGR